MTNTFTWTSDQEFIFSETIENPKSSFIIDSCAGASKTTTLTEMVNRMVAQGVTPASRVLCLAFNKKTAEALQDRMPPGTVCSTLNAFGHRALMSFLPVRRLQVSAWKEKNIWQLVPAYTALEKSEQRNIDKAYIGFKIRGQFPATLDWELCRDMKNFSEEWLLCRSPSPLSPDDAEFSFARDLTNNSTELDGNDWVELFRQVATRDLYQSLALGSISFQDQLYLPAIYKEVNLPTFPHVLVDEAQDLGSLEHALLKRIVSRFPKGRLLAVGDRAQAIYAFRGAHYDSLDRLAESFQANWLSLPVSFRCPQAVVTEAQKYDHRIEVWEGSDTGQVETLTEWSLGTLRRPSTILCRVNYPLVQTGLKLIKLGIGAKFLARDFEQQLTDFFTTWRKKSKILPGMFLAIEQEIQMLEEKDPSKANRLADNKECLEHIRNHYSCEDFESLQNGIRELFNSPGPITLATIHKAKGMEWPTVYLLRPDLCPHPNAVSDEDIRQEHNMCYVAITRSQDYFAYLPKQD